MLGIFPFTADNLKCCGNCINYEPYGFTGWFCEKDLAHSYNDPHHICTRWAFDGETGRNIKERQS